MNVGPRVVFEIAGAWQLLAVVRAVKFSEWNVRVGLPREDLALTAACVAAAEVLARIHPAIGVLAASALAFVFVALWLDALLFRTFTIELGPGGAAGVVPSVLLRELFGMAYVRAFLRGNPLFVTLPLAAVVMLAGAQAPRMTVVVVGWALAAWAGPLRHQRARGMLPFLALIASSLAMITGDPRWTWGACSTLVLTVILASSDGPLLLRPFFSRPPPRAAPTPQHTTPIKSDRHGLLQGADVVLLSIESLGAAHVGGEGARLPLLERLSRIGLSSQRHHSLCALTNEAHALLYSSDYEATGSFAPLEALAAAGYDRVYATTTDTREYGLRQILERGGFDIIDARSLSAESPTDRLLPTKVVELLRARGRRGPVFLHVHTANSHVPYRVDDARFSRFDSRDDRGRYLNSIEEADHLLDQMLSALQSEGIVRDPLVILTADHGQSFGESGYRSHGSAVVREQMQVPLAIAHPRLTAHEVEISSHLDVLPTVLDLVGIAPVPARGRSLFATPVEPDLVLWAGRPSRARTSNYGRILGRRKWMVDTVLDRVHEMGWDDEAPRLLEGDEKRELGAQLREAFVRAGLR